MCKLRKFFLKFRKPKVRKVEPPLKVEEKPKYVRVRLGNEIVLAEVIKENPKTYIVKLPDGHIIKRHREKHVL